MQFKKTTLSWLIFIIPALSMAQSTNLPQGAKENWLLNRMDIKLMNDSTLGFSTTKPYLRKTMVEGIERYFSSDEGKKTTIVLANSEQQYNRDSSSSTKVATYKFVSPRFSGTDMYNMFDALMNSTEWVTGDISSFKSKKPVLGAFYKTKADFSAGKPERLFPGHQPGYSAGSGCRIH